jgi:hypothetical protein
VLAETPSADLSADGAVVSILPWSDRVPDSCGLRSAESRGDADDPLVEVEPEALSPEQSRSVPLSNRRQRCHLAPDSIVTW